jgi:hypothetical protein
VADYVFDLITAAVDAVIEYVRDLWRRSGRRLHG